VLYPQPPLQPPPQPPLQQLLSALAMLPATVTMFPALKTTVVQTIRVVQLATTLTQAACIQYLTIESAIWTRKLALQANASPTTPTAARITTRPQAACIQDLTTVLAFITQTPMHAPLSNAIQATVKATRPAVAFTYRTTTIAKAMEALNAPQTPANQVIQAIK
jgi:hypothetical protein